MHCEEFIGRLDWSLNHITLHQGWKCGKRGQKDGLGLRMRKSGFFMDRISFLTGLAWNWDWLGNTLSYLMNIRGGMNGTDDNFTLHRIALVA
ncbi:hypothetical protein EYC84_003347 [Monilinia fructicola]|uniref:Uncharacterized protein n=1 Tax=Monilinia fructicola TaxID=38448 RepID=A0A5M9JYG3_MONFR|nr:hypothetical protein EYC84_003347 [Monilinia fructicola]